MHIIGIDGGGTKTVGILSTAAGQPLARIQSGPSNYHVVGEAETQAVLEDIVEKLCAETGVSRTSPIRFCLGMAGLGRAADRKAIGQICDELGIRDLNSGSRRILTHDAHIALVGGTGKQEGVIVISGTGAIVYGIDAHGKEARASGWGYHLGDEGSGYDIAIKGLRAIARAADSRDDLTQLTSEILNRLGLNAPNDLIRWIQDASRDTIADLAAVVFDAARAKDRVAERIIDKAADELVCAARSVIEQLEFVGTFDVVLSGGNLIYQPIFVDKFRSRFARIQPEASVRLPKHEPAYGAVLMAIGEQKSLEFRPALTDNRKWSKAEQPENRQPFTTEQRNPNSTEIDLKSISQIVRIFHEEDRKAIAAVEAASDAIAQAIQLCVDAFRAGGRLFYIGAGTSGRLGVLDASECPPTFSTPPEQIQGIIAGGDIALRRAVEGEEDKPERGAQAIRERHLTPQDVLVGIASSGRTPYVIGALKEAHAIGATTICLCCVQPPEPLKAWVTHFITPIVGPEIVTGSTRLKAGTATKLVLNMLTTTSMIKLGKVYDNLMVDVHASNAKLVARSIRIVQAVTGVDATVAEAALTQAGGSAKLAIVMLAVGLNPKDATAHLEQHAGFLRKILDKER